MTPLDILAWLTGGGFTVEERGGRLWVSPGSQLSPEDAALVKEHREALLAYLRDPVSEPVEDTTPMSKKRWIPEPQQGLF